MGLGIKETVSQAVSVRSHGDAIRKALERGFTRDREVGQGNGLAGSVEIMKLNQGGFEIWSGDARYEIARGVDRGFELFGAEVSGTGVSLRFDTRRPVDRGLTFMGRSPHTYLEAECDRILDAGGLLVAEECAYYGSRDHARSLRRKIISLLPDLEGPLVLDFANVTNPSSSFLDELLGRLAEGLGPEEFRRRILVRNATPTVRTMADVVIHQRLNGLEPPVE